MPPARNNRREPLILLLILSLALLALLFSGAAGAWKQPPVQSSHAQHEQMGIGCESCHPGVEESATGADNLLPVKSACLECHDQEDCAKYNCDALEPGQLEPITGYSKLFSHARHQSLGLECERCHQGITASDSSGTAHLPRMALCMECHDGQTAKNDCRHCHEEGRLLPATHKDDRWMVEHVGAVLLDDGQSCTICHTARDCQRCHEGENLIPTKQ